MKFDKSAITVAEQITLLKHRGLIVNDEDLVTRTLAHINYYRLRAYWLRFEQKTEGADEPSFMQGTRFEDVLQAYTFDQKLRAHLLVGIETLEVSLRTQWSYQLGLRYGAHAYIQPVLFKPTFKHAKNLELIAQASATSVLPPLWVVSEGFTLGELSHWLSAIKSPKDRQAICKIYAYDEKIMCAYLHHIAVVRNLCAHHSRVWDKKLTVRMIIPNRQAPLFNAEQPNLIYNTCVMLALLLKNIDPNTCNAWTQAFFELLKQAPKGFVQAMGFIDNWQRLPPWTAQERSD